MSKICWYCEHKNEQIADNFFGDFNCEKCGVENDCLNPVQPDWLPTEEEKMAVNYNDEKYQGKFVYMPKVGESAEFDIKEIKEVQSDNPKFNFTENVPVIINGEPAVDDEGEALFKKKDLGYHIEVELVNGKILSVTNMAAFISVFKKHNIQDGEKVLISHPDKGVWKVEKI